MQLIWSWRNAGKFRWPRLTGLSVERRWRSRSPADDIGGPGIRSDTGRDCRNALKGLAKTCDKLGIAVWDYLGSRLKVAGHIVIQPLDRYVRGRFRPA